MKNIRFIVGIMVIAATILTACDTDNEAATYQPKFQNISIESPKASYVVSSPESDILVRLVRSTKTGEYVAHYTLSSPHDGIFTDTNNGQVTFADGSSIATIIVKTAGLEVGKKYTFDIKLSDADIALQDTLTKTANHSGNITVELALTWAEYGVGKITSEAFEGSWDLVIEKAEGMDYYKAINMYNGGFDVVFSIDNGEVIFNEQPAWVSSQYGNVSIAGKGTLSGKTITAVLEHYIPGVGTFGDFTEVIELP